MDYLLENFYSSFSRNQEREADYYAIETLNKLNISSMPLIKFLNFLEKKSLQRGLTEEYYKFSSHPIYKERYEIINSNKKNNYLFVSDLEASQRYNYIKAKFFGFTESNISLLNEYLENDYLLYSKSIILSKKGKLKESMKILNKLIKQRKNYIYLLETKADILYSNGFNSQSLQFYEKISKLNKLNHYVSKRIFDIKFTIVDINNKDLSKTLFRDFSYLLKIFAYDFDLKIKCWRFYYSFFIVLVKCEFIVNKMNY